MIASTQYIHICIHTYIHKPLNLDVADSDKHFDNKHEKVVILKNKIK